MDDQQALELRWIAIRDQLEEAYGQYCDRRAIPFGGPPEFPDHFRGYTGPPPPAWVSDLLKREVEGEA